MGFKLQVFGIVSGLLVSTVGIIAVIFGNGFIHSFVSSNVKLDHSTELFKQWVDPPVEIFMYFYLFDLKNGPEFLKGAKPVFEEIGPFVYNEYKKKDEIVDNLNSTLTYKERQYYIFRPDLSPYPDTYPITSLNMAPVAFFYKVKYAPNVLLELINGGIAGLEEKLLVNKTAKELLFGYKDDLLTILKAFNFIDGNLIPSEYVGLFYGKNDTVDGLYTIYSGNNGDSSNVGVIERFNHEKVVNVWSTPYSNMINGTDGTIYPPFVTKDPLYIFSNDLCRSIYLNYNETVSIMDVEVLGFKPSEYMLANHSVNPDNIGWCTPIDNCLGAGVLNLTNCVGGIPIIMSNPHFLYGDEKYPKQSDGLKANVSAHITSIYIEPTTGLPFQANKRIQFNTYVTKDPRIDMYKNLPEVMFPLFWVDENFKLDEKNANKFKNQVKIPLSILNIGKYVLMGVGLVILSSALIYSYLSLKKKKEGSLDDTTDRTAILSYTIQQSAKNDASTTLLI